MGSAVETMGQHHVFANTECGRGREITNNWRRPAILLVLDSSLVDTGVSDFSIDDSMCVVREECSSSLSRPSAKHSHITMLLYSVLSPAETGNPPPPNLGPQISRLHSNFQICLSSPSVHEIFPILHRARHPWYARHKGTMYDMSFCLGCWK